MLIGVGTLGGPWNIVLHGGSDPHSEREGDSMQPSPNYFGLLLVQMCKCQCIDVESPDAEFYDLVQNPERFTGYAGQSAVNIWKLIYDQNCFK